MNYLTEDKPFMKKIAEWHTATFDSSRDEQIIKLQEELSEARNANSIEEWYEEMADVLFVISALVYRYNDSDALLYAASITNILPRFMYNEIRDKLNKKFEINKNRKWEKQPDGTYHHI